MPDDRWRDDDDDQRSWGSERNLHSGQMGGHEGGYGYGRMSQYGKRERSGRDYDSERQGRGSQSGYGGSYRRGGQDYGSGLDYDRSRDGGYGSWSQEYGYGNSGYSGSGYNDRGPDPGRYGSGSGYHGFGRSRSYGGSTSRGNDDNERGFMEKASDEVSSWFGDESAERRRDQDKRGGHYGRGPKGYTRSDDRIREDVNDKLTDDWRVDASEIDVSVSEGEVTLTGTVNSRDEKRRAEDCAEGISGVKHVQNNIRVHSGSSSPSTGSNSGSNMVSASGSSGSSTTGSSTSSRKESRS